MIANSGFMVPVIEAVTAALEFIGVAVIVMAFLYATIRIIVHWRQRKNDAYDRLRLFIGRGLQLGLEFLVAADVIRTVLIQPTMEALLALGLLIIIRTALNWSITVDIEGCWPWEVSRKRTEA